MTQIFPVTLTEFCTDLSSTVRTPEHIAMFEALEIKDGHKRDTVANFKVRWELFNGTRRKVRAAALAHVATVAATSAVEKSTPPAAESKADPAPTDSPTQGAPEGDAASSGATK